jgi:hypothetical protein
MNRSTAVFLVAISTLLLVASSRAVEVSGGTFNTTAPTSTDIPNWNTGWGNGTVTGWNYVGTVNGASGVYLGNGWAITAGHVGAGSLVLGGNTYSIVAGSAQGITNGDGSSADLVVFKLTLSPNLPSLNILSRDPNPISRNPYDSIAMLGYGGGQGETWGFNAVTAVNLTVPLVGFVSNDLETALGTMTAGSSMITNNAFLVGGDSGGGDFIFDSSTQAWTLAGLNEAIDGSNNSYLVQLNTYASQINAITGVPEPSSMGLLGFGLFLSVWNFRRRPFRRAA